MRTPSLLFAFLVLVGNSVGRTGQVPERVMGLKDKGVQFVPLRLFSEVAPSEAVDARWKAALKSGTILQLDLAASSAFDQGVSKYVALELPTSTGTIILDLIRTEITTEDFKVSTASGAFADVSIGVHYRGMVQGKPGSLAAISVFGNEVMGLFNDGTNEYTVGRFEDDRTGVHVLYKTSDLRGTRPFTCGVEDTGEPYHPGQLSTAGDRTTRCVRYYWEVNYDIFQGKGSVVNATNYVVGLFNQSTILFDNDGIDVTLSEVFVWDVPSPYTSSSTSTQLSTFGTTRTSFNGDMAHLLGYAGGGGIAWLNTLCNSQTRLRMAYSDINSTFSNVPVYSWSVEVVTHEQGHNLGSKHTHACAWNGNATAIDGCGPAAGYTEGSCANGPIPNSTVKGTIMSYCHLVSGVGINFNNGFGPQPTAVIVNAVNGASCLSTCGTSCDAPGNLSAYSITVNSATLSWSALGATTYTLRWKPTSSGTWTVVTGLTANTYPLTGLTQGTSYEFQVLSVCGATSSAYSNSYNFTTTVPCPDSLEPNNSTGTAPTITLPATISALIASASDADYYRFVLTATSTVNLSLTNLAGDYDLRLLNGAGAQLAISEAGGTTSESISYPNAVAGTYFIHVFGYNGAFSATQCYTLNASAFQTQGCDRPTQVTISAITYQGGTVNWPAVLTASSYDVRWTVSGGSTWTNANGVTGTSHPITGLAANTAYDVQVRANCSPGTQGGSSSEYSTSVTFTTLTAPCEIAPPVLLAVRVVLDGPYNATNQLMADSLRQYGRLPLIEPYSALGYLVDGTASTTTNELAISGPDAIVDWVLVELRDNASPATIVEVRAGLLQRDGDIVAVDGTSALGFCSNAGTYRVAVRHRNHLGVMTANGVVLGSSSTSLDLTSPGTTTYGNNARRALGTGQMTLWSGNTTGNTPGAVPGMFEVKYSGAGNDRDMILAAIGGSIATNVISGYYLEDCNLDSRVKYSGPANDRDLILANIGGSIATNVVEEQLP